MKGRALVVGSAVLLAACSDDGGAATPSTAGGARSPGLSTATIAEATTTTARPGAPRVWAAPAPAPGAPPTTYLGAIIVGTLRYDAANDCFLLEGQDGGLAAVVWPVGTTAAADGIGVTVSDGRTLRPGDLVSGGGGYLDVAEEYGIPAACNPGSEGDVAVFNAGQPLDK